MKQRFKIEDHLAYRRSRYEAVDINNPMLRGLSTVEINPTELCNRTCSFCPRSNPKVYPNQNLHMTVDTATLLVEQLHSANFNGDIHITGFGEPLLNPNILDIAAVCASKFHTELITNGDNIRKGKITIEDIEATGLDLLIVDCYDGDEQIDFFEQLLDQAQIKYKIRNHYDDGSADIIDQYGYNNRGGALFEQPTIQQKCYLPFYKAFLDWDGSVRLCCNDWFRLQDSFGNIYNSTFSDIWNSDSFIQVRKHLAQGARKNLSACAKCNTRGTRAGVDSFDAWSKVIDNSNN